MDSQVKISNEKAEVEGHTADAWRMLCQCHVWSFISTLERGSGFVF